MKLPGIRTLTKHWPIKLVLLLAVAGASVYVVKWYRDYRRRERSFTATEVLAESTSEYGTKVRPVLLSRCVRCHGPKRQRGGLRVDTVAAMIKGGDSGPAIVPGNSSQSLLLARIVSQDMPEGGPPLSALEVEYLRHWIDDGARAPRNEKPFDGRVTHWSFQPVSMPAVPDVSDPAWSRNPIDAFLAKAREKAGLPSSPPAPKSILLRRVSLDLTGLPPTMADYEAFDKDSSPEAYEIYVDRLLASPQYAERWARHWMDVWRYSSHEVRSGGEKEIRESSPFIWRWRDWIIQALREDKGYHHMIVEMLAGDEMSKEQSTLAATGYLVRNFNHLDHDVQLQSTIEHMGRGILGLTLGCARCHDHKFDPISQKEYYQIRAFFEPHTIRTENELAHAFDEHNVPTYIYMTGNPKNPIKDVKIEPRIPEIFGQTPRNDLWKEFRGRRLVLAKWLAGDDNPLTARVAVNHIWLRHFGKALVETTAEFGLRGKPPTHPELLDWLASQFRAHDWSMKWLHKLMVTSQAYQMSSSSLDMNDCVVADPDNLLYWRFPGHRAEAEVIRDSILFLAGELDPTIGGPEVDVAAAPASRRRSLYLRASRADRVAFLDIFDAARVEECYRRAETIVPQQSLALLNSQEVWDRAKQIAHRLNGAGGKFVPSVFQLVLGRVPTDAEEAECKQFLTAGGAGSGRRRPGRDGSHLSGARSAQSQ